MVTIDCPKYRHHVDTGKVSLLGTSSKKGLTIPRSFGFVWSSVPGWSLADSGHRSAMPSQWVCFRISLDGVIRQTRVICLRTVTKKMKAADSLG